MILLGKMDEHVVETEHADVDTGARADKPIERQPRVLHGLPSQLENELLLGIETNRLVGVDVEEARVKLERRIRHEPTAAHIHFSGHRRVRIVESLYAPALRWNVHDGVPPLAQELPESCGVVCTPRKPTGQSDNSKRFGDRFGIQ